MFRLTDGSILYHGSYTCISDIDLEKCRNGLDFGKGFYLTSSFQQAQNYVRLSVAKAKRIGIISDDFSVDDGQISVFQFHYDPNLLIHYFRKQMKNGCILSLPTEAMNIFMNFSENFRLRIL